MTSYHIYQTVPLAPLDPQCYHLGAIQSEQQGLKRLEEMYNEKSQKYANILERLTWLNACSRGISVATGISSVITFSSFIRLPVSITLGAASLTVAIASGIISALTKKYQKKLTKATKLTYIITPTLAVFETSVSKALKNDKIDEEEFNMLQTFHLKMMNELIGIDHKIEAENRNQFEKSLLEEINEIKKNLGTTVY